jgi:ligand-binding sensor domain-containing protein/serine phosphatase RsbU (regulator of sigma subunit)
VKRLPVLLFLLVVSFSGSAQYYQFFNYGLPEGLCDKFTYTINQDRQGFLWIGTGKGLCRFDGKEFDQDFKGDSIPASIAFSSLLDSRGRLWFGHENGMVSVLEDGEFTLVIPDGVRSAIHDIKEDGEGNILALQQQGGLIIISSELELTHIGGDPSDVNNPFAGKSLNCFEPAVDGTLLVGTNDGLSIYRFDSELETYIHTGDLPDLEYLVVQKIVQTAVEDELWAGTEDEGLFRIRGTGYDPGQYEVEKIGVGEGLDYARISSIVFNGPRRVWITDDGVGIYRFELDENGKFGNSVLFNVENGIPNEYINDVFIDEEGNQWFSSQGNGIAVLRDQAFTFFDLWGDDQAKEVSAIYSSGDDHWFGGSSRIAHYSGEDPEKIETLGTENGLPNDRVTALYRDVRRDLYIGTEHSGLYVKREGTSRVAPLFISGNSLENTINAIEGNGDSIFVATINGIYSLNLTNGHRTSFSTANGLPHNKVNDILVDEEGTVWIATITPGLVGIKSGKEIVQVVLEGKPKLEFRTLALDEQGDIWAGTDGDGIFRFSDDTLQWYDENKGLMADFVYAIGIDPRGFVWVGHRGGLSRIDPVKERIRTFGKESGFTADISHNAVTLLESGKLLFGSSEGVIQYDAFQAREDTIPPRLSFKSVVISDVAYDPTNPIRLKYDKYRLRIDFVGINLSNPEQVTYQYKLDGYEDEWSDVSGVHYASYGRVEDGDYTFMLRACDGNGNCSVQPLTFRMTVKIPVWKAWWFILSAVLLVLATIFAIFKIRERNQKAIQEYLQRQLDERTREVVMQKEEIEIKNRDITDSINYAQRIQASILPPIKKLHDAFSGSFVFYQPRDIVSGDFYWYEKVGESRFIVVCADSTGHGVPGAFMSMIGTTLIKDICLRAGIQKPSEVLNTLDKEVRESLNQNVETNGSNDGMDIIVAEIDMKSLKFTVSSAMRPVIIYSGEEQIYVKGSRSSVGGQLDEDRLDKDFIDQEFHLKKGDIIYMFSDGYPDQFGGPLGRKFKMVRLKNLLRDIHDKPMDEQYNYIKSNFFLWKEDLEQVDDVLFMGIKL